jgi:hypothetical protein
LFARGGRNSAAGPAVGRAAATTNGAPDQKNQSIDLTFVRIMEYSAPKHAKRLCKKETVQGGEETIRFHIPVRHAAPMRVMTAAAQMGKRKWRRIR